MMRAMYENMLRRGHLATTWRHLLRYTSITLIADKPHAKIHVGPWCLANCSPTGSCNAEVINGISTQACEQLFSILGRPNFYGEADGSAPDTIFLSELAEVQNQSLKQ